MSERHTTTEAIRLLRSSFYRFLTRKEPEVCASAEGEMSVCFFSK